MFFEILNYFLKFQKFFEEIMIEILTLFGAIVLAYKVLTYGSYVVNRFLISADEPGKYGKYSVITGATDGIGKAIAFELAKKKQNLLLISRTQSKLDSVAQEIKDKYNVEIDTLAVDYSDFGVDSDNFAQVKEKLNSMKDLGILINNVGISYPFPKYFHELTDGEMSNLITLNVTSTTLMTKLFLNVAKSSKKGLVVNIGSFAGVFPSPLLAQYSAAKVYIESFTKSLSVEYKKEGIKFQCHVPLYIVSKMSKIRKGSVMVPTAEEYASMVVSNLGKGVVVSPHFVQSFLTEVMKQIPEAALLERVLELHKGIRIKGLKKLEREKKQ